MPDPLDIALDTAREAGRLLREYAERHPEVRHKTTEIDLLMYAP